MAHASNENAVYPTFVWDTFPKAGASQLHPHMHVFLSPNYYQGNQVVIYIFIRYETPRIV